MNATSLRYGFEIDRSYLIELAMQYQLFMPIITLFLLHSVVEYLLIFENKTMKREIRLMYILTHISLILTEWVICFAFRIYAANPFAVLYCEGPICRAGIDKRILLVLLTIPTLLLASPFLMLMTRMHQMLVPKGSRWKLSSRLQIGLAVLLNILLIANGAGCGYFGKDHDESERLIKEPELAWLSARGGTLFLFGPPGDPQYFIWEVMFIVLSFAIISPFLVVLSVHAMITISRSQSAFVSSKTQAMAITLFRVFQVQGTGAILCSTVPLCLLFGTMTVDITFIPGWLIAPSRFIFLIAFTLNGPQFCIFFIVKNPAQRKILVNGLKMVLQCKRTSKRARQRSAVTTIALRFDPIRS